MPMRFVTLFTDGACMGVGTSPRGAQLGAGIVSICDGYREEWAVPIGVGTSQQAELLAIKVALKLLTDRKQLSVLVITDSQYACNALVNPTWNLKKNLHIILPLRRLMRQFGDFNIRWVKGHAAVEENIRADLLAAVACGRRHDDNIKVFEEDDHNL
jgi:ribonuclease HI